MNYSHLVAAAAPCLARNSREEELILGGLKSLSRVGIPLFIADGGSSQEFIHQLKSLPNLTLDQVQITNGPRLIGQVKWALSKASQAAGKKFIFYTEPDKKLFFERQVEAFLAQAGEHPEAAIIIASRDRESFSTFPSGQQLTEKMLNELCGETFGEHGDFLYGPLLIHPRLVSCMNLIQEDIGWGWRIFMMAMAKRLDLPVVRFESYFPCPEEQRGENDLKSRIYRMEQLSQNVKGLTLGLKCNLS